MKHETLIQQLLVGGVCPDTGTSGGDYRQYLVGVYIYPFAFITHAIFFSLFLATGITPLWVFNIGSMLLFLGSFQLNRRGHYLTAFTLGYLEVITHAWVATLLIGWFSGFHYFIFVAGAGAFFVTIRYHRARLLLISLAALAYAVLRIITQTQAPAYSVNPELFFWINIAINAGTFIALGFLANYQNVATMETEKKLEEERSKLQRQNEAVRKELTLARKIQRQHIPSTSPHNWISFYYKPMQLLGGDFFDFITFPSGKLGIFLSDVSGHGAPAALVTSIIKSYSLQFAHQKESPASYLNGLNSFLQNRTGGNFVTAFYGILDHASGELTFSNAGHNHPLLINADGVTRIHPSNSSPPLNVLNNEELAGVGKSFTDETILIQRDSRILLYTDGLTEAIPVANEQATTPSYPQSFEQEALYRILNDSLQTPARELIAQLIASLTDFRGVDHFDDDICLICADI